MLFRYYLTRPASSCFQKLLKIILASQLPFLLMGNVMKDNNLDVYHNTNAVSACEEYLRKQQVYNIKHEILTSENRIIERLFARRLELKAFYKEIYSSLEPMQWERVLSVVLYTAAFWNPEAAERAREAKSKLIDLNRHIEKRAQELFKLLQARSVLSEEHGFHSYDGYHIADLIDEAAKSNGNYQLHLKEPLQNLASQFDFKYWPSVERVVDAIANDAQSAKVYAYDSVTRANISSSRISLTDYYKAFFQALDDERESVSQFIPDKFEISDESLASVVNCALGLIDDNAKDGQYVKRLRQRIRDQDDFTVNPDI